MKDVDCVSIIKVSWKLYDIVEFGYLVNGVVKNSLEWLEKQCLLLVDMVLYLFQILVKLGDIDLEKLINNLYVILMIID